MTPTLGDNVASVGRRGHDPALLGFHAWPCLDFLGQSRSTSENGYKHGTRYLFFEGHVMSHF